MREVLKIQPEFQKTHLFDCKRIFHVNKVDMKDAVESRNGLSVMSVSQGVEGWLATLFVLQNPTSSGV
tara:strand:- start:30 stop:233 length:204 start_codon:yes stop_codon:yes gene_type:complete